MFESCISVLPEWLIPHGEFHPFPTVDDRSNWKKLSPALKQQFIADGEQWLEHTWPAPQAAHYTDFVRSGNRTVYESALYNRRRLPLLQLTLAEAIEDRGRFLDDILNGLWATLDEASWVVPAHNGSYLPGHPVAAAENPLPNVVDDDALYVDLFCAECAAQVALVWYLLGSRLSKYSPEVEHRVFHELNRRIFRPFLTHTDFHWMGLNGERVNNWNPWILSNVLTAVMLGCPDEDIRVAVTVKAMRCLESFIRVYTPDGGCDEGPGYWTAAGASLFDCIDILHDAAAGKIDFYSDPLIRNICAYIYRVHIDGNRFINYADAHATLSPNARLIYRMGQLVSDRNLEKMGIATAQLQNYVFPMDGCTFMAYRTMKGIGVDSAVRRAKPTAFPYQRDLWLPGIQVMAARERSGSSDGLYLSAKGGHNAESHNHNDVGSFILYCDGEPVIVDIGSGTYEKKTFSAQRYEIPQNQSAYHNIPEIGGIMQKNGREFAADSASYACSDFAASLSVSIKNAYPAEAGILVWNRVCTLDRAAASAVISDSFRLEKPSPVAFHLMLRSRPRISGNTLILTAAASRIRFTVPDGYAIRLERFPTKQDASLNGVWGDCLYRLVMTSDIPLSEGDFRLVFTRLAAK